MSKTNQSTIDIPIIQMYLGNIIITQHLLRYDNNL